MSQSIEPYGRLELKQKYHKYFIISLIIAVSFHFLGLGGFFLILKLQESNEDNIVVIRIPGKNTGIGQSHSIQYSNIPHLISFSISSPVTEPSVGLPVPVPDAEANPDATIASQDELSKKSSEMLNYENNIKLDIRKDIKVEQLPYDPGSKEFIPVEKQPSVIFQPAPKYPEFAQRARIEGKVWVKILVDKEGKPQKANIIKSDAEIFNNEAIDAAMSSRFIPALVSKGPISCWIVIPYKFKLK